MTKHKELDQDIIHKFQEDDKRAFKAIYDHYFDYIYYIILRMVHQKESAADLTHDIFIKIYEKRAHFNHSCLFSTWLYRITVNHTLNQLKKEQTHQKKTSAIYHWNTPSEHEPPSDKYEEGELYTLLMGLKPEYRICLIMKELEDLSYETIASTLDINIGTVKSRINRAKKQLRDLYNQQAKAA